jgi:hypothetical protein
MEDPTRRDVLRVRQWPGLSIDVVFDCQTGEGAGDVMIGLVMGSLVENHPDTAETLYRVGDTEALLGLPFALAPVFVLGTVLARDSVSSSRRAGVGR